MEGWEPPMVRSGGRREERREEKERMDVERTTTSTPFSITLLKSARVEWSEARLEVGVRRFFRLVLTLH